jgi:hypothetical protein
MRETVRALFGAVRLGLARAPGLFKRLRLHFVGTSYSPNAASQSEIIALAREIGIEHLVTERPSRVSYLDALQLLLDSHALPVLGSDEPHYTASKLFPYILAERPLLTIFHEDSNVVDILRQTQAGQLVTYSAQHPLGEKLEELSEQLERVLRLPSDYHPPTRWEAFELYTTRAMTARLAHAFDQALLNSGKGVHDRGSVWERIIEDR